MIEKTHHKILEISDSQYCFLSHTDRVQLVLQCKEQPKESVRGRHKRCPYWRHQLNRKQSIADHSERNLHYVLLLAIPTIGRIKCPFLFGKSLCWGVRGCLAHKTTTPFSSFEKCTFACIDFNSALSFGHAFLEGFSTWLRCIFKTINKHQEVFWKYVWWLAHIPNNTKANSDRAMWGPEDSSREVDTKLREILACQRRESAGRVATQKGLGTVSFLYFTYNNAFLFRYIAYLMLTLWSSLVSNKLEFFSLGCFIFFYIVANEDWACIQLYQSGITLRK